MIALLFTIIGISMLLAAWGRMRFAYLSFGIGFVLALIWFHHHATSSLTIQL